MSNALKKIITLVLTVSLVACIAIPALAQEDLLGEQKPGPGKGFARPGMRGRFNLEIGKLYNLSDEMLAEIAEKRGITLEELKENIEERLEKIAEEKGITVDELKQEMEERKEEMEQKREEALAKLAEEKGITLDELNDIMDGLRELREEHRAQMMERRQERLEEIAEERDITVEELKQQFLERGPRIRAKRGVIE